MISESTVLFNNKQVGYTKFIESHPKFEIRRFHSMIWCFFFDTQLSVKPASSDACIFAFVCIYVQNVSQQTHAEYIHAAWSHSLT